MSGPRTRMRTDGWTSPGPTVMRPSPNCSGQPRPTMRMTRVLLIGLLGLSVVAHPGTSFGKGGASGDHSSGGGHSSGGSHSPCGSHSSGGSNSKGPCAGCTYVKRYTRKDGSVVPGHYRHAPGHGTAADTSTQRYTGHLGSTGYVGARDSHGKIIRSEAAKGAFLRMTGYPHGRPGYLVDHIVPLKRGGCDCP